MTAAVAIALVLAVLIGLSLGTLGSGGSIVTMPVLVYVAGIPASRAVGMSLVIVGATAAAGSLLQARHAGFDRRAAAIFPRRLPRARAMLAGRFSSLVSAPMPGSPLFRTRPRRSAKSARS